MDRVSNTHTDTLHRPRDDRDQRVTQCGALVHVSPEHVEMGSEQTIPQIGSSDAVTVIAVRAAAE